MANYEQTLERYITSQDFKEGVISATKASWGGSGYKVELFADGTWRNLWNGQIGNKYETSGALLSLPTLSEENTAEIDETDERDTEARLSEAFDLESDDMARQLREELNYRTLTQEVYNG